MTEEGCVLVHLIAELANIFDSYKSSLAAFSSLCSIPESGSRFIWNTVVQIFDDVDLPSFPFTLCYVGTPHMILNAGVE